MSSLSFIAGGFAIAGLVCASVPLIIHLLNRRRYKTVNWAAMDFLRQALQRNRRIMQIRDLILLALRTAAVLLFGLALAQPFLTVQSTSEQDSQRGGPVHAVLVLDNSMSMGYVPPTAVEENRLDVAKAKASEFIDTLPAGSHITVVPLCGSPHHFSLDPYRTKSDAVDAVKQIEVVDRSRPLTEAVSLAAKAQEAQTGLSTRIVFFSDQQLANWSGIRSEQLKQFPTMKIVDVSVREPENSWISDFRLEDGVADVETPAKFTVRVRHQGPTGRKDVPLSLWVDGEEVVTRRIELEPGTAEREFELGFTFGDGARRLSLEAGKVSYVPVKVTIGADEHDRLLADNQRHLVAPVVAALPVVFVDEQGADGESNSRNNVGETWQLRRLLAPVVDRNAVTRQLVRVLHISLDELSEELLADARLVVIAGVDDPASQVDLLHDYVDQGGQLFIAAGGDFNPRAWSDSAWRDGNGILPAPLESDFVGGLPNAESFSFFKLDYDEEMKNHAWFRLGGVADESLADLYSDPLFFQAVRVRDDDQVREELVKNRSRWLTENLPRLVEANQNIKRLEELESQGTPLTGEQDSQLRADRELVRQQQPNWLQWKGDAKEISLPDDPGQREKMIQRLARETVPQVLARFENGAPYIVQRQIGDGRVVFCSSGMRPLSTNLKTNAGWNTIARENAVLVFDRILRSMIRSTLPDHNFIAADSITVPLEGDTSGKLFELQRPARGEDAAAPEQIMATFTGSQTRGLSVQNPLRQGIYTISAYDRADVGSADPQVEPELKWQTYLAVNATDATSAGESDLEPLTREQFQDRVAGEAVPVSWVDVSETITLEAATIRGRDWWWYLVLTVFALLLLVEIPILAWPALSARLNPPPAGEAT